MYTHINPVYHIFIISDPSLQKKEAVQTCFDSYLKDRVGLKVWLIDQINNRQNMHSDARQGNSLQCFAIGSHNLLSLGCACVERAGSAIECER